MKTIYLVVLVLFLSACSGSQLEHSIDKGMIAMSGNKPPAFFKIANLETMRGYVFNTKDFSFSLPSSKESDFSRMGGWDGISMRDGKTIALGFTDSIVYHIVVSTSGNILKYGERERAAEYRDHQYIKSHIKYGKDKYGREGNINAHYETHGEENYSCMVKESKDKRYGKWKVGYHCYKFNPSRTLVKGVTVVLTYNKPKDQTLAKQYNYQDLKKRAKRMLDSLYIKDGW